MHGLRILGGAGVLHYNVAAFTPLANVLNIRMAGTARLEPSDAIVVMGRGGADGDGVLTNRSLRRLLRGVSLYREGLAPILVLSGTKVETRSRLELARGLGVPETAILTTHEGLTTKQEAAELSQLLQPLGRRRILLVADPIDMPRARSLVERAGFVVHPAPTAASGPSGPESRLGLVRDIAIELTALGYYRLTGAL